MPSENKKLLVYVKQANKEFDKLEIEYNRWKDSNTLNPPIKYLDILCIGRIENRFGFDWYDDD